jgi:acetoacetate decarboxylase
MGYVKTPQEIADIERELGGAGWNGEWLSVRFRTSPETIERLLPPPLQPTADPVAAVTIGRWTSSCLGDFHSGVLYLAATYEGVEGNYVLALYMDSEPPIVFGREMFGEPKKLASVGFAVDGDHAHGWIDRNGVRILEVQADTETDEGPAHVERCTYNFKARTAADGRGLQEDALLTRASFTSEVLMQRVGPGTVHLGHSVHDPLDEIEVVEVVRAVHGRDETQARCAVLTSVPAETFLPYHYGRQDDWLALAAAAPVPA